MQVALFVAQMPEISTDGKWSPAVVMVVLLLLSLILLWDPEDRGSRKAQLTPTPREALRSSDGVVAVSQHRIVADGEDDNADAIDQIALHSATEGLNDKEAHKFLVKAQIVALERRRRAAQRHRISFFDAKCNASIVVGGSRYITAEPMKDGYGLTNQLLAYVGLIAWAREDVFQGVRRRILMPPARTYFLDLIDVVKSRAQYWSKASNTTLASFVVHDPCELPHIRRLRIRRLKDSVSSQVRRRLDRRFAFAAPTNSLRDHLQVMSANVHRKAPLIAVWDMYQKWPFGASTAFDFEDFLCGLKFCSRVEAAASDVARLIGKPFMGVHLRMEPQDMSTMRRSVSDPRQVIHFFLDKIRPVAVKKKLSTVVVAAGRLNETLWATLKSTLRSQKPPLHLVRKEDFLSQKVVASLHDEGAEEGRQQLFEGRFVVTPTTALAAAVDLLLLSRASVAVVTAYSSLTAAVYAMRCCRADGIQTDESNDVKDNEAGVFMYDVYRDGSLSRIQSLQCGFMIGEYLVSPRRLQNTARNNVTFFYPHFNPTSPLFNDSDALRRNSVPLRIESPEYSLLLDEARRRSE